MNLYNTINTVYTAELRMRIWHDCHVAHTHITIYDETGTICMCGMHLLDCSIYLYMYILIHIYLWWQMNELLLPPIYVIMCMYIKLWCGVNVYHCFEPQQQKLHTVGKCSKRYSILCIWVRVNVKENLQIESNNNSFQFRSRKYLQIKSKV